MFQHFAGKRIPIKAWTRFVPPIENEAMTQLLNVSDLPIVHKHVAVMPDVHFGIGATVGSVVATKKAIIPAAVGVDIGCGMCAVQTSMTSKDLPDSLRHIREAIEKAVPHGRSANLRSDVGSWRRDAVPQATIKVWKEELEPGFAQLCSKYPQLQNKNHVTHLGTLGWQYKIS